ncbi:hypothetical protein [Sunxiuqinia indica]|uniref:hypothetical protein n=1 Tax=Sunxiuqinia indica TaxID=2692584 RepID=UPI001356F7C1|nr:hypothetical protein [Sunxiuqinia indica]
MNDKPNTGVIIESCLKAVASQFPIVSGVASLYADWKNQQEFNNIRALIQEHAKSLKNHEDLIDKHYLETEDYIFTLHRTVDKAKNEIRESKKKLFADFLTQSCLIKNTEKSDKFIFLEILDKVDIEHIKFLSYLNEKWNGMRNDIAIANAIIPKETGLTKERVNFLIHYFISIGLLVHYDDFEIKDDGDLWSDTKYYVSGLGSDFLEYLKE